ncbi:hypothetical protein ACP4OV_029191 [Aristida adscensionis]
MSPTPPSPSPSPRPPQIALLPYPPELKPYPISSIHPSRPKSAKPDPTRRTGSSKSGPARARPNRPPPSPPAVTITAARTTAAASALGKITKMSRAPSPSPRPRQIPQIPHPPRPNPKPTTPSRPRVSIPLHRMSDPAAAGALVPAAGAGAGAAAWADGAPRFGDMVWGKVKSHPWWPGHIYSIDLTDDEEVRRGHRDGLLLVAFFGDSSYGWFEPHELVPFEDHFADKAAQGGTRSFAAAVAEAVDEIARRSALALLCPCRRPAAFRPHPAHPGYLLVDVPGFDSGADYHPDQVAAARARFVPRAALDHLLQAAVAQRDAAEAAARTVPGIEMAGLFSAYRRATYAARDDTYAEAFGVDPEKARAAELKAAAERAQRARPLQGQRKTPETATAGRRRGGAGGAAARLMEKIVPGASAMKAKASKKDQYLLKRRETPEPSGRPAVLPDAPAAVLDDGPPGFGADPPTPPLPGSTGAEEEEFLLQRRASPPVETPPAAQASEGGAAAAAVAGGGGTDAGPKKAAKPKKARKREREEAADAGPPGGAAGAGEPKKKKKKKKLSALESGAAPTAPAPAAAAGSGKPAAFPPPKVVGLDGLDLKEVVSDLLNLPLVSGAGDRRISDSARSFVLAFRSKYYKKSYENDPPEEPRQSFDKSSAAAADAQPPKKKKLAAGRPAGAGAGGDPAKAGVKRGPSDRQEEMAVKKKAKLDKIKTLSSEKKAAGAGAGAGATPPGRPGAKEKAEQAVAKKKAPAPAPRMKTPSPTALMMRFPPKTTLPSVASLKARFARFGPLDVDGIRVYWKSYMCRVIYRFRSDAEAALKYAKANSMFGQVDTTYYLREVESAGGGGGEPPAPEAPQQRTELRLMETTPFRPGSSGNGAPLQLSRAVPPARAVVGQQPKSILKKSTDDGAAAAAGAIRDVPRVKFMLGGGDSKLEAPAMPASGGGSNGADSTASPGKTARSVGFAPQPLQPPARTLQPPMRPTQQASAQQPRTAVTQPLPLPPPPPLPYQPRASEGGLISAPPYPPRHGDQPPPPYHPHAPGFPGHQPQPYPPRSGDSPPLLPGQPPQQHYPPRPAGADDIPAWKRSKEEFKAELMRVMTGIAKMVEPLTDKNGFFPYHLFRSS